MFSPELKAQVKFMSINLGILEGELEMRHDRNGVMPTLSDIQRRFEQAAVKFCQEWQLVKAQARIAQLEADLATARQSKAEVDDNSPF